MTLDWRRAAASLALLLGVAGCTSDDPPTLELESDAPRVTSDTLPDCSTAGPGETVPRVGCIDEDGRVIRP